MKSTPQIEWPQVLMAILLYATVIVYQGYVYGAGDQTQILPCLYALDHPGFFVSDHYVSAYLAAGVNERTIFHFIFRYLGYNSPLMMLIWHAVFSIALFMAWLRIASIGLKNKIFQYLAVSSIFILGFHTSVGGNELYYNLVVPSLVAKAIASWALYFWLEAKYKHWIIGLIIATFIQPLVGLQLFLITAFAFLLTRLIEKAPRVIPWRWLLMYVVFILPWFYLLLKNNGSETDSGHFMDIMYFRLSHHFFPGSYGWFNLLLFAIMSFIVIRFYKHRLRWFMVLILLGCVLYTIGVEILYQPVILYSQWFKTTIWLEAFAILAIFVGVERWLHKFEHYSKYWIVVPVILFGLVGTYRLTGWFGALPEYMLPGIEMKSAEVDISEQAQEITDVDAVFIVPIEFTAFRWYAKRNLYVDYKALFHSEEFLNSWYDRIGDIYAYGINERNAGFDLPIFSEELFANPSQISIDYWKGLGITHFISTNPEIMGLEGIEMIGGNERFYIYRL